VSPLLFYPEHPGEHIERAYSEETARRLGVGVTYFPTSTLDHLNAAFAAMASAFKVIISAG
jgi:putative ABC transport system substrate-binding protein